MYLELFRASEQAARILREAQLRAEEHLLEEPPPPLRLEDRPDGSPQEDADPEDRN